VSRAKNMTNFQCIECNYESEIKTNLMKHEQEEHNIFRCHKCVYTAYNKRNYNLHMYKDHSIVKGERFVKYLCENCKERFYDILDLEAHFDIAHIEGRKVKYSCNQCNFQSFYKIHFTKHVRQQHCKTAI
jgi:hypothetical protein